MPEKETRYRVRNVPKAMRDRFCKAAKQARMTVGPALTEAMSDWIKKQNEKKK